MTALIYMQTTLEQHLALIELYKTAQVNLADIKRDHFPHISLKDKGWRGKTLEHVLQLQSNNQLRDFSNGELKTVPIILKNDIAKIKETVCVTILNPEELLCTEFLNSNLYKKIQRTLFVLINNEKHSIYDYKIIDLNEPQHKHVVDLLSIDYASICEYIIDNLYQDKSLTYNFTGKLGKYVQPRPKVGTKGEYIYAFYFKTILLSHLLLGQDLN